MEEVAEKEVKVADYRRLFEKQRVTVRRMRVESIGMRIDRLKKIKSWVETRRDEIAQAVHKDFRKPSVESDLTEAYVVLSEVNQAIKKLKEWSKPKPVPTPVTYLGSSAKIVYEPKGVCLIIAPWNFPFNLTIGPLVSAIAAGNTAIIKPSEMTPHTSKLVEDLVSELFSEDEVAVVQGAVKETTALLKLPFDHIFFTGSPQVGKIVMRAAAENLSSVTLELGGKSPLIIDDKVDLKDAVEKLVWGKYMNNGQTCIAPDYVFVPKSKKDELIDLIRIKINDYYNSDGEGIKASEDYARIINRKHFDYLSGLIEDAVEKGAELEFGGEVDSKELFISPTVLSGISEDMKVFEEEIFGPILPVLEYTSLDEVINVINDKPKPLALYVFSNKKRFTQEVQRRVSSGTVCVNDNVVHFTHPFLPFGGVNHSGIGNSHGYEGFKAFSNEKPVLKQRVGFTSFKPLYPPYTSTVKKMVNLLVKHF